MAQFTVNNLNDSGIGSLRQAIEAANATVGVTDEIVFASTLSGTITLTSDELQITDSLTIRGSVANLLAVSGGGQYRVFEIDDGKKNVDLVVAIDGLTITQGFEFNGGGIVNRENTTITNSIISQNTSKIDEEDDSDIGGGILNDKGTLTIRNSTISGNSASSGGGIFNYSGELVLINSTVSGNTAIYGGGIYNGGTATVTNSTIANNSAVSGKGLYNYTSATDALTISNTIIANSTGGDFFDVGSGTFTSIGNLVEDGSDPNALSGDPLLGPLQNNGGTTPTHELLPGSIAINAGNNANIPPGLTTDQRGSSRLVDGIVDIGAYEFSTPAPLPQLSIDSVTVIDDASVLSNAVFTVTLSSASSSSVTVQYSTGDGSALAGVDYTPQGRTLTIKAEQTTATIMVPIIGDTLAEPDEVFFVSLSKPSNAEIAIAQGSASIITLSPAQYGASYPDLISGYGYNLPALTAHYLNFGLAEGRSPDRFDENHYVASNTDLIAAPSIVDATTRLVKADGAAEHYIRAGLGEGRSLTSFQRDQYIASYSDLIAGYGYDLTGGSIHYVGYGFNEGRAADTFDEYRYLAGYDDLLTGYGTDVVGATQQYLLAGSAFSDGAEGRDPLAFKSDIYIASYGDLIGGVKAIADYADKLEYAGFHYVTAGRGEGRAKEVFDPSSYLAKNPDLAAFGSSEALTQHYIEHGYDEGRIA